ncbi:hypothetical protein DCS_01268 [Drechmeria coniospora]|uniref:Uncharacterized protein n=1 Tax=Drechmeria coniospora TaxID=98403 RepID=A0A151GSU1_DRECN|nr:hypothetical protein DCS_01268 [Drechmeria coniospora]KYK60133.1 hypothetical protein DCS_01268 [Drechmeria coniospora]
MRGRSSQPNAHHRGDSAAPCGGNDRLGIECGINMSGRCQEATYEHGVCVNGKSVCRTLSYASDKECESHLPAAFRRRSRAMHARRLRGFSDAARRCERVPQPDGCKDVGEYA